jgi:hypothetical protein
MGVSAFGVDHGPDEIEKLANPLTALRTFGGAAKAGQGLGQVGGALKSVGSGVGGAIGRGGMRLGRAGSGNIGAARIAGPGRGAQGVRALGRGQQRLGAGLNRVGTAAVRRPGLTGGTALTGGVGAVGGTGYAMGSRRRQ